MNAQEYYKSLLYKVKYAFVTCYILVLLLPQYLAAQQYFIKSYAADNGLPTNIINDACQDKDGNMWFSTYSGISKYDGFSFYNFDTLNGLPDQHYRKLRCDEKGILWAVPYANKGKIVFLQDNSWKSIEFPKRRPPHSYVTSFDVIYKNNSPVICVGTYAGIDVYQNKKWQHYNISDEKSTNIVYSVTGKNTSFYIGTKTGLCVLNDETLDWSLNNKINTHHEAILAIKFEKPGLPWQRMWILTQHSVSYFQNNKLTPIAENFLLEDIDIAQFPFIGLRKNGNVIFGSNFSKYLLKISDRQAIPLRVNNGFSANGASSVFIDREENIWFTDSRGIDKISDLSVVNYFQTGGMPENEVTAIAETNDGRYVLGHNNRISILQDHKFKVIEFPGTKNNLTRVLDIMKDRDGNIWFSANNLGIGKLTPKNAIKWYKTEKGFLVSSVCQDLSGRIWFGTNRKLFYLEAEKMVEYEHNDMLNGSVRKIYTSNKGGIFVTGIGGLWYVDNDKAIKIKTVDENQELNVFSYYKDNHGTEFVGTMNGLYYIKDNIITRFTENGLRINNPIYFIIQDKENFYWFGTNNGVYRWDGINDPELFNTFNGLAGRETNRSAGLLDSKGRVWVGTDRGLSCFLPGDDHFKTPAPLVRLLSIETLQGEKYPLSESVSIGNTHNTFSFHFRGISFVNEELITYKYKLEGYDKEWHEATQAMLNNINYINVKPGRYRLCVKAKNYSSSWSKVVCSEEISIGYPFYLKWWFIVLSLIIIIGLLYGYYIILSQRLINKTLKKEISDRKQAEAGLKESEQRLSFVLEGSMLGTWDWDIETNVVKRNHICAEMLGFRSSELGQTTQHWNELIHPEDRERVRRAIQNHIEGKTALLKIDYRMRTKDNKYRWIHDRATIVQRDTNGKPIRMSGTHADITERKQSLDALQKSEERLRLLLGSLPVAIYIAPANPEIDLEMITGNINSLTGFTENEFLSKPDFWRTRIHPDDRYKVMESLKLAPAQGGLTIEYRWQIADGTYRWIHDQSILKTFGTKREYLGVFVDINDRKLAEQEINNKNEQLNLLNAEKDKLFSIISHDLRSPVTGFMGLASVLIDELERLTTDQIRDIASSLYNSATKVNELLNDLLEWSQLQRGLTIINPAVIELKQVADDCVNLIAEQAKSKDIVVRNEISAETKIDADIHALQVVIRNLLSNALKYTPKGGIIKISAETEDDQFTRISISDTGIGMNSELITKLFKVNEKTSRKGTEGEPSSGLGLILCKEFVEKQKGIIWAESEEGKGSTFTFTVPNGIYV